MWNKEKDAAVQVLCQASLLARLIQGEYLAADVLTKPDHSPVTVADFTIQALVVSTLSRAFPDIPIVAEEESSFLRQKEYAVLLNSIDHYLARIGQSMGNSEILDWLDRGKEIPTGRFWTLDPIDGTKGFLRNDQFAIALALIEDGKVVLGLLACPQLCVIAGDSSPAGYVFSAQVHSGCEILNLSQHTRQAARVSNARDPISLVFVESYESSHTDTLASSQIQKEMGVSSSTRKVDGQPKYGLVAAGEADVYLRIPNPGQADYKEKVWDHAAGALAVQEAGGRLTDIDGKDLDFRRGILLSANRGILATNGWTHEIVLEGIRRYFS